MFVWYSLGFYRVELYRKQVVPLVRDTTSNPVACDLQVAESRNGRL
jgi:hypothetical protein